MIAYVTLFGICVSVEQLSFTDITMKGRDFMKKTQLKNSLLLLLTATIWGVAFVAQSVGMDHVGPFTFNAVRSIIGGIVLIPCIFFLDHRKSAQKEELPSPQQQAEQTGTLILGGVCCGILLALASSFQQMGIQYTTVGRAGFITACYIVIVPILGHFFLRKKCGATIWIAVALALAGLYLLCITDGFSVGKGDLLVMVCSLLFSLHILVIDYFSPKVDGVKMSCIQFFVCVHPADHRTERYEPDCGFSDLKSGILHLGTGRLDPSESEAFRTRVIRMCADVCSDHSGTASLREKSIICLSNRMLFSVKSEKLPVFFMNMILKKTGNNSVGGHVFCQNSETYKSKCHHRR